MVGGWEYSELGLGFGATSEKKESMQWGGVSWYRKSEQKWVRRCPHVVWLGTECQLPGRVRESSWGRSFSGNNGRLVIYRKTDP